jgi:hypothetical protein
MILALLLSQCLSAAPPAWVHEALSTHTSRTPWRAEVRLQNPTKRDRGEHTAKACRDQRGERVDLADGKSRWDTKDSSVLLLARKRMAIVEPQRPPLPPQELRVLRTHPDTLLGRKVQFIELEMPGPSVHRFWIDTTLDVLLRSERTGKGPGPLGRTFLSLQLGQGCAPDAFQIPAGWTRKQGRERPMDPRRMVTSVASQAALQAEVGYAIAQPSWLPPGFRIAGWGWFAPPHGKVAQIRLHDGNRTISIFFHPLRSQHPKHRRSPPPPPGENIVHTERDGYRIGAVGPISEETLRKIINGLQWSPSKP